MRRRSPGPDRRGAPLASYRDSYSYEIEYDGDGSPVGSTLCICLLGILGPTLLVVGLVMGITADDTLRSEHVTTYNHAVAKWTSVERARLASVAAAVAAVNGTVHVPLDKRDDIQDPLYDHADDLAAYDPLQFRADHVLHGSVWDTAPVALAFNVTRGHDGAVVTLPLPAYPLALAEQARSGGWKDCYYQHHGSWMDADRRCVVYKTISSVCVKISGEWALDAEFGGFGCTGTYPDRHDWPPVVYQVLRARQSHNWEPTDLDLPPVPIIVRSAADPYIAAWNLTGGTLEFGATKKEQQAGGMVMFIVGAVLTVPPAFFCITRMRRSRRGGDAPYPYMDSAEFQGISVVEGDGQVRDGGVAVRDTWPI